LEARWEHTGKSLEEDHKTHRKNIGGCRIGGKITFPRFSTVELSVSDDSTDRALETGLLSALSAVEPPRPIGFGLHPKKIGSGHRCASRRRTREWT
ncbi:hypothetical protein BHE74_00042718, partial [Ensete ventricosum]